MTKRLALGTAQFGMPYGIANTQGKVQSKSAERILQYASESGIDTIDTAIAYGESESLLGSIGVSPFKVISKLPALPSSTSGVCDWALRSTEASLSRLKKDSLDGLLLHRSADLLGAKGVGLFEAMCQLKSRGLVKKIGISVYSYEILDLCVGRYQLDLVQAPFNLVDRRFHASGWLQRLASLGCEVHVRSAFLQGLLLLPREQIPAKFERWSEIWNRWHGWLQQRGEPVSACLSFPMSFPQIDRIVVGVNDLAQLRQIVGASQSCNRHDLPDLACDEESLINPAKWPGLWG